MKMGTAEDRRRLAQRIIQPDEPANIQYTSVSGGSRCKLKLTSAFFQGTTGKPKGATLTHHNIVNNAHFVGRRAGYHEGVSRQFSVYAHLFFFVRLFSQASH